jgi:hypothetical protein
MLDTKNGLLESKRAFDELGISVLDASGQLRPMNDVMLEVADKFSKMEDGTLKAALAQDLFGRSGMQLIPMLNLGAEGLRQEAELAKKLGIVFDQDAASAADKFNDALAELKASIAGAVITIGTALMPTVKALVSFFTGMVSGINNIAKENSALTKTVTQLALAFGGAATVIGTFVIAAGTAVKVLAALTVTLGTTRAALMLSVGAWTAAATAVGYYVIKLGEVAEAEALADKANEQYWQTYERFRLKLLGVATAAGMNVYQFNELTAKYGENLAVLALAIKRGDEGVAMQKAMAEQGAKNVAEFEKQRLAALGLAPAVDAVSASYQTLSDRYAELDDDLRALRMRGTIEVAGAVSGTVGTLGEMIGGTIGANVDYIEKVEGLFDGLKTKIVKTTDVAADAWSNFTDGLQTSWASAIGNVLANAHSLADALAGVFDAIKRQFFDMVGQMVAKWVASFVIKTVTSGPLGFIGSIFKGIGKIFGLAEGFEGVISKPTPLLVGEAGPEYVSVTPLSQSAMPATMVSPAPAMLPAMAMVGGGGAATITFNMNAPLVSTSGISRRDLEAAGEEMRRIVDGQLRRVGRRL